MKPGADLIWAALDPPAVLGLFRGFITLIQASLCYLSQGPLGAQGGKTYFWDGLVQGKTIFETKECGYIRFGYHTTLVASMPND